MTPLETLLSEADRYKWQPIADAQKVHQSPLIGQDLDVGIYNMHWRDDKQSFCYDWNQQPCHPVLYAPFHLYDTNIVAKLAAALRVAVDYIGCSEEVVPEALAKINAICQDPLSKGRASEGK